MAREEQTVTRHKLEATRQITSRTRQQQAYMKRAIATAQNGVNEHHQETDHENEILFEMEGERGKALMERQQAQRELDEVKAILEKQRLSFLDQSREFQASCKRVRIRSSMLGLDHAPLMAFATVTTMETEWTKTKNSSLHSNVLLPNTFDDPSQTRVFPPATTSNEGGEELAGPSSNPRHWIPNGSDEPMSESLQAFQQQLGRTQQVRRSLEKLKPQQIKATDQEKSRSKRQEQLLSQLNRIKEDCERIEKEIAKVQHETVETKELGQAFEKDVKAKYHEAAQQRFEAGITGNHNRARTRNPYAKQTKTHATLRFQQDQSSCQSSGLGGSSLNNSMSSRIYNADRAPPASQNTSHSQHQSHLAGPMRVDRQFASMVSITAPPGTNSDCCP